MNKKTKRILLSIYIIALFSIITSSTMAFFTYIQVSDVSPRVNSTTAVVTDWLLFNTEPIYIRADATNFGEDMGSLIEDATATATLRVENNEGLEKRYNYNIKLSIESNNLVYSTPNNTPELLIKVHDPNGIELTHIEGLNYVTSNGYSGFDVTTVTGDYYIANNYEIKTSDEVRQTWNIELIFINLETNQDVNTAKDFNAKLEMESIYNYT